MLRAICWLAVASSTVWAWNLSTPIPVVEAPSGVRLIRDAEYRRLDGRPWTLDLLVPLAEPAGGPHPILIAVHGGSWTGGTKRDYAPQFLPLVRRGIAVAVVDYRLARPGAPSWDGALQDVLAAVDWTISHAGEHHLDPARVAIVGTSAGGLLAARAGQVDPRIRAIVCLSTPSSLIDLEAERALRHEPVRVFLGGDESERLERAGEASPLDHVDASSPPVLMIHGDDDAWVSVGQARKLRKKLDEAGVANRLIEIEGARHGFELNVGAPAPRDLTPDVLEFLDRSWESSNSIQAREDMQ